MTLPVNHQDMFFRNYGFDYLFEYLLGYGLVEFSGDWLLKISVDWFIDSFLGIMFMEQFYWLDCFQGNY